VNRTIVFANRKGGCGKTTTAVNVAHGLSFHGRVLFIDMDAQAHASTILASRVFSSGFTITEVLEQKIMVEHAIEKTRIDNLFIVRSSRDLGAYELVAGVKEESAMALVEQLRSLAEQYDFIIIDPPPTLGILMVVSLVAAQEVYIPMPLHFLAVEGLAEMMQVIYRLNAGFNPDLHLAGIIPTFFNKKTRTAQEIGNEIKTNFGDHILLPGIRNNINLAESPAYKQTIFEYAPKSIGAEDYTKLITIIEKVST